MKAAGKSELIEVPTNSAATVGESHWSTLKSPVGPIEPGVGLKSTSAKIVCCASTLQS